MKKLQGKHAINANIVLMAFLATITKDIVNVLQAFFLADLSQNRKAARGMDDKIRICGTGWAYCDGDCANCPNSHFIYTAETTETYVRGDKK